MRRPNVVSMAVANLQARIMTASMVRENSMRRRMQLESPVQLCAWCCTKSECAGMLSYLCEHSWLRIQTVWQNPIGDYCPLFPGIDTRKFWIWGKSQYLRKLLKLFKNNRNWILQYRVRITEIFSAKDHSNCFWISLIQAYVFSLTRFWLNCIKMLLFTSLFFLFLSGPFRSFPMVLSIVGCDHWFVDQCVFCQSRGGSKPANWNCS